MFNRPMLLAGVLIAAVVAPYLLMNDRLGHAARGAWSGFRAKAEKEAEAPSPQSPQSIPSQPPAPVPPPAALEQVFRFDITPQWVSSHWPRVSTVSGEAKQLGMRAAFVSGTRPDDVAGSLTYYFDEHHQLQRITFSGLTSEPRRLMALVVTPNGLKSQPTTNAAHYISGDPQKPTSQVIVKHATVAAGSKQPPRAEVAVDLRRTDVLGWREKTEREPELKILPSAYRRW